MGKHHPSRPPRITAFQKFDPPLYFITLCTFDRKAVLATPSLHDYFVEHMKRKSTQGIMCGEYVVMPDHIHLFLRIDTRRYTLGKTVGFLKQALSKPLKDLDITQPHWQPGFFDHILRNTESYSQKWEYVRNNPVRAGLVLDADDWKFQGMVVPISY